MDKLALFDLDGTLITMWSTHEKVHEAMFNEVYGVPNVNFRKYYRPGETNEDNARMSLRALGYDDKFIESKMPLVKPTMEKYYKIYNKEAKLEVLPGVKQVLDRLITEKVTMGVVTGNSHYAAKLLLEKAGLAGYFSFIVGADDTEVREERIKKGIEAAQNITGIKYKSQNIFFFDDSDGSIPISRKLGINSVSVATGDVAYEKLEKMTPNYLFRTLTDVNAVVNTVLTK